jgi:putative oxidoreductase
MTLGLLILRLLVGLTLAAHGSQKLFAWFGGGGLANTGAFFENALGFRPGRTHATMAGLSEFGGGLLIAIGLFTPLACAAIVGVMAVAGWSAHRTNGFFITNGGYEYTAVLGGVAAALAFTGPGRFSFDHALGWNLSGAVWGFAAVILGGAGAVALMSSRGRQALAEPEHVEQERAEPQPQAEQPQPQPQAEQRPPQAERQPQAEQPHSPAVAGGREAGLERAQPHMPAAPAQSPPPTEIIERR